MRDPEPLRVLIIDDNADLHQDFERTLSRQASSAAEEMASLEAALFGSGAAHRFRGPTYEIHHAYQGEEGLALFQKGIAEGRPYHMAFVDFRMPPGWDGVRTLSELWKIDPTFPCVLCTAYSDYDWNDILAELSRHSSLERFLVLRKPFDPVEAKRMAFVMTALSRQEPRELQATSVMTRAST